MKIPHIYIAGPFAGATSSAIRENCYEAVDVAVQVAQLGGYPVLSHALGMHCMDGAGQSDAWWYQATLDQMLRCDAVLMMPNWRRSHGAVCEHDEAERCKIPIYYSVAELAWLKSYADVHSRKREQK